MCTPRATVSLFLIAVLVSSGCDPGYRLRPVGWTQAAEYEWSRNFERFSMRTSGLGGLIGEWWIESTFEIFGNSEPIILRAASLRTTNAEYAGAINPRQATAPSGGGIISASWRFDENHRAPDVLGQRAEITLDLEVGTDARTIRTEYERAE